MNWTAAEGVTCYQVYRAGEMLTVLSAPQAVSSYTYLGRSLDLAFDTYYQIRARDKAGCSPLSQ